MNEVAFAPTLFIVGFPKCGTSSLHHWLDAHPELQGSTPKETFFLVPQKCWKYNSNNYEKYGFSGYKDFFPNSDLSKIRFESSAPYVYYSEVLDVISLIPDAKILVVVRDPVDRLYSTYKYFSNNNYIEGSSISFLEYFELSKDNGLSTGHELFDYGVKHSKYSEYLPAWLALGEKIKVLSFSEINDNPASLMKDISGWLSIDPSFYSTFSFAVKNKTVEVKNKKVHKMVRWISSVLPKGSWRNYFIKIYKFINFEKSEKFLSDSTIDKVKKYYQEEYAFLSRIGINL